MAIEPRKTKDGAMRYRARIKDPAGIWYPSEWKDNEADAKRDEADLLDRKFKGAIARGGEAKKYTLNDYWEVWSIDRRPKASEGWRISQDQMYRDYVEPVIGRKRLSEIKEPEIGKVLKRMRDDGYAENTVLHAYTLLNGMFDDAVGFYKMLAESPVNAKYHRPKPKETERDFWEPSVAWKFLEWIPRMERKRRTMLDLAPAVYLQLLAGMRVSEVQALKWSAVQFGTDQIKIAEIWNNKTKKLQPYPKGKRATYVPIIPVLKRFLVDRHSRATSDFVAPAWNGKMMSYETYHRALRRACKLAEMPPLDTQELRHTCTEIWVYAGASREDISRLLNHASPATTKRYMHRTEGRLQTLAQAITPGSNLRVIPGGAEVTHGNYPSGEFSAECRKEIGAAK